VYDVNAVDKPSKCLITGTPVERIAPNIREVNRDLIVQSSLNTTVFFLADNDACAACLA
jgi:hypothetical protein